jgi:hypothetical protein
MSTRNTPNSKRFSHVSLGQYYPSEYPTQPGAPGGQQRPSGAAREQLGPPLSIRQAAEAIGYSVWTVRQVLIPQGLPCFRSRPGGKLIFYSNQIADWIRQQQGGQSK